MKKLGECCVLNLFDFGIINDFGIATFDELTRPSTRRKLLFRPLFCPILVDLFLLLTRLTDTSTFRTITFNFENETCFLRIKLDVTHLIQPDLGTPTIHSDPLSSSLS